MLDAVNSPRPANDASSVTFSKTKTKRKLKTKNHRGRQAIPLKSWRFWRVRGYVLPSSRSARLVERVDTGRPAGQSQPADDDDDGDGRR
jgi:hypothetical protein